MSKPDLSIIIVNWKVKDLVKRCLDSILNYKKEYNIEIFVIDNDSRDGSVEMIQSGYPQVNLIALNKNIGFGRANNLAIAKAQADYVLILNPDTEITENFFDDIFSYAKENPQLGIVGPKILNSDGSVQHSIRRFPDLLSQILILLKLKNVLKDNKILNNYLCSDFDYEREQEVDQIMGAAMFIPKNVLDKIGVFDEHFFVWYEEVDLCLRAKKAGFSVKYYPGATMMHKGGRSFKQSNVFKKQLIFNKSLLYYFSKHKPRWQTLIILLFIPINIILTVIYVLLFQSKRD